MEQSAFISTKESDCWAVLCATTLEIHGHNFKVRPVYKLCDFCVETFSVTEACKEKEIFGLNRSWKLAK